jgi:hypothetical protein
MHTYMHPRDRLAASATFNNVLNCVEEDINSLVYLLSDNNVLKVWLRTYQVRMHIAESPTSDFLGIMVYTTASV